MKRCGKLLLLPFALGATFAVAQTPSNSIPQVQHVIVVVQENRTPTNLFQEDTTLVPNGAHIVNQGYCGKQVFSLQPDNLYTCYDPGHGHGSWATMWKNGTMSGACDISVGGISNSCRPTLNCPIPSYQYCPQMTFVLNTQWDYNPPYSGILDPYFQIANQGGFANYMFQTNQGPSFPAHQFLLSGTSAPISFSNDNPPQCYDGQNYYNCYEWFDAENVNYPSGDSDKDNGCIADSGATASQISPERLESLPQNPLGFAPGFPCYDHPTLIDLLDNPNPQITWKYYARSNIGLWTAPNAINRICQTSGAGGTCTGPAFTHNPPNVVLPNSTGYPNDAAPILTDIQNCNLPQVSWVIPDGNWSDHAASGQPGDGGPSWVAAIVNAISQDKTCELGNGYWSDTVTLITWDDWGGYYDDVAPPDCIVSPCSGYSNKTGGQYVYGFRVPLLVVGAYAKPGYISGAHVFPPNCAPPNTYCHDFGSILNFIEYAFGTGGNSLGEISPLYHYADALVMDQGPAQTPYSLYDFFDFR